MTRALALAAALAAFAPGARAAVKNPDTLVALAAGDIDSLDPAWSYDSASNSVICNVYEYLLTVSTSGTLAPMLATQVPSRANGLASADGLTFRFPIRAGVKFHDGSTLTPEDARYSVLRFMLFDRDGGPSGLLLKPVLGLTTTHPDGRLLDDAYERASRAVTVDGDALVIRLQRPFAPFLSILSAHIAMMSKPWAAAHGQWDGEPSTWRKFNNPPHEAALLDAANGTGAFKLERLDKQGRQIVLARHKHYWRAPARLSRAVIRAVPEFATRKLMLMAGDADTIAAVPANLSQLEGLAGVEVVDGLQRQAIEPILVFYRGLEPRANPNIGSGKLDGEGVPPDFFGDKDVRLAFAYSVDYPAFIKDMRRGKGRQAAGIIPAGLIGHRDGAPRYRFDPAQAAEHLRRAWGGELWKKGFRLALPYPEGRDDVYALLLMLKRNIEALNPKFKLDVRAAQNSSMMAFSHERKLPLVVDRWFADYPDPDDFAFPLLHSQGPYQQRSGMGSPEMDALIDRAAAASDPAERAELYESLQRLVDDRAPLVPVYEGPSFRVQRAWVKGFVFRPSFAGMPQSSYLYDLYKAQ